MNEASPANDVVTNQDGIAVDLYQLLSSAKEQLDALLSSPPASFQNQALLDDVHQAVLAARQKVIAGPIGTGENLGSVTVRRDIPARKESEQVLPDSQAALAGLIPSPCSMAFTSDWPASSAWKSTSITSLTRRQTI
jgi:hypothetical protein